jgi:hypothetical protein
MEFIEMKMKENDENNSNLLELRSFSCLVLKILGGRDLRALRREACGKWLVDFHEASSTSLGFLEGRLLKRSPPDIELYVNES